MNQNIANANNAAVSQYRVRLPSGNLIEEKTAQGVSVVPPEQVSPLLVLPNELLVYIADHLSFADLGRLATTSKRLITLFNTEERLKKLSVQYYGSVTDAYRKIIENSEIPSVPYHEIEDPLLRLTYLRYLSSKYLSSLGNNTWQTCVLTLNGHTEVR